MEVRSMSDKTTAILQEIATETEKLQNPKIPMDEFYEIEKRILELTEKLKEARLEDERN
jgi:hypothetical protein